MAGRANEEVIEDVAVAVGKDLVIELAASVAAVGIKIEAFDRKILRCVAVDFYAGFLADDARVVGFD